MEYILWNRNEYYQIYNCTGINVNDIPIEKRQYPIAAIICIILGLIYYPLYFPCIYSFWKNKLKNPCYILLIYLSLLDICLLWIPTIAMGILSLNGVEYCSSPFIVYFIGCAVLWCSECIADLNLGINRCIELSFPKISKILFYNKRVYIWIILCNLYGLYWIIFHHPTIFSGIEFGFVFDPLDGYKPYRSEFFNKDVLSVSLNNTILALASPTIYFLFIIFLFFKARELSNRITKEELMVFIQVFIISMLNTLAGIVNSYEFIYEVHNDISIMIAHFSWLHIHGFPPVIYLLLNKTVRTDTKKIFNKLIKIINNKIKPTNTNTIKDYF
ncbi:hypothetical protein Mgra_00003313, partial [Meloidogyne graminicola]